LEFTLDAPDTLRRLQRELVRRKWDQPHRVNPKRTIPLQTQLLVWRLATENPTWGYLSEEVRKAFTGRPEVLKDGEHEPLFAPRFRVGDLALEDGKFLVQDQQLEILRTRGST
jgi:hypothetical protein